MTNYKFDPKQFNINPEKTCTFTGHRPDKLYGYNITAPKYQQLSQHLAIQLSNLIETKGVDTFVSGGALGFDTVAFLTVDALKAKYPHIKNILAIPFEKQTNNWKTKADLDRYAYMKSVADENIYVDQVPNTPFKYNVGVGEYTARKMQTRNQFMVDVSANMVALWDKSAGGTGNCMNYCLQQDHFKNILVINPQSFVVENLTPHQTVNTVTNVASRNITNNQTQIPNQTSTSYTPSYISLAETLAKQRAAKSQSSATISQQSSTVAAPSIPQAPTAESTDFEL